MHGTIDIHGVYMEGTAVREKHPVRIATANEYLRRSVVCKLTTATHATVASYVIEDSEVGPDIE